jgi:hypothetical protein
MSMRAHLCGLRGRAPHLAALSLRFRWPRARSEHLACVAVGGAVIWVKGEGGGQRGQ